MAQASAIDEPLNQELYCPICLEFLNEPVTLHGCFHSFCRQCLVQTIDGARDSYGRNPYSCPQCRRTFSPSDVQRVNQHLQNIVESHQRGQERRVELRQSEDSRNVSNQIDRLNSVLTTAEDFVESLVTALDYATRSGRKRRRQRSRLDSMASIEERLEPTAPLLPQQSRPELSQDHPPHHPQDHPPHHPLDHPLDHPPDCEFEAETHQQFWHRSVALCRRHFLLIMIIIHASIFVVCLIRAMM